MLSQNPRIGFIGFGELAYHFSKGLKQSGIESILTYDAAANKTPQNVVIKHRVKDAGVSLTSSLADLVKNSELVISAVWGSASLETAKETARLIGRRQVFADINNTAPAVKNIGSKIINAAGAKYVDMALFGTPTESAHKGFTYIAGDGAEEFKSVMSKFDMNLEVLPGEAGKATTLKTLANIYYKGVEGLYLEVALSAHKNGIDLDLLGPLLSIPITTIPREEEMAFWIIRGALHAERKITEIPFVIQTMKEWGIDPVVMEGVQKRFNLLAQFPLKEYFNAELDIKDYKKVLQAIAKFSSEKKLEIR